MPPQTPSLPLPNLIRSFRPLRTLARNLTTSPPPLPSIPTCPPPTCTCACAPTPPNLAIDHTRSMNGTIPPYAQHVVIRTGRGDWSSRIEDEPCTLGTTVEGGLGGGNLARTLKGLVGKGGRFHDPSHPVFITNSSGQRGTKDVPDANHHVLQIFPQNLYFPKLSDKPEVIEDFAWRFLSAERKEYLHHRPGRGSRSTMKDGKEVVRGEYGQDVVWNRMVAPTILICGHMSRDSRCGILGPVLEKEFNTQIWKMLKNSVAYPFTFRGDKQGAVHPLHYATTHLCSHVGGHAFAGNVIMYFPADFKLAESREISPLAGKSVWYGRVEPRHVEGIIDETLLSGKVIEELLRGVHDFPGFKPMERDSFQDIQHSRGRYLVS